MEKPLPLLAKRNRNSVTLRERFKSAAVAGVRCLGHDLPSVAQHAGNVTVHRLHARQQSLPIVFSCPIPFIGKRFNLHTQFPFPEIRLQRIDASSFQKSWESSRLI